jgi:uncharacterized protein (UPF0371 family)
MMTKILGLSVYKSPTDMGVNMVGCAISDDDACRYAANQEIIRRYFNALCSVRQGLGEQAEVSKIELLMNQLGISVADRPVVDAANAKSEASGGPATAIQLDDGRIVTGKTSSLLGASSSMLLNVLKELGGIPDEVKLLSPTIIEPIQIMKTTALGNHNPRLHTDEVLVALSICAATDQNAKIAMDQVKKLRGLEAHSTVILSRVDEQTFRKLGINLTCEPKYQTKKLYHA